VDGQSLILAVVWVPRAKRGDFVKKIAQYLLEDTVGGKPRHNELMACIEDIRASVLDDFWPRHELDRLPNDQPDWVEAWLASDRSDQLNTNVISGFMTIAQQLEIRVKEGQQLHFPERTVVLIYANRRQLNALIESCDHVAELRLARECAGFLARAPDAIRWVLDLAGRTIPPPASCPSICVLDTGVNSGHPLLQLVCAADDCLTVVENWGTHDHEQGDGHGTSMAGLAAYGPLNPLLVGSQTIQLTHRIESVKLIGPIDHPESIAKDLWGAYTLRAAAEIDSHQPQRSLTRSFCLAITSMEDRDRGKPSSWSGAVDQLASGFFDGIKKLIVVSAGNIKDVAEHLAYPSSNLTAGIEDPAQAWNALTVGAYTELINIHDPDGHFRGYTPVAEAGDLSPYSKTAWSGWDKAWPLKPEIVCEGGNLLKSPDERSIGGHRDLDVLTISNNAVIQPLTTMWATSGAAAQAAWMAGQIQAAYPNAWPETVRALLVHSARWTPAMLRNRLPTRNKDGYRQLIQTVGFGAPNLNRALASARNSLTLIAQQEIQPFAKKDGGGDRTKDMHVFSLPWPKQALLDLPPTARVTVRIALSYFVEPSPQEIGWKDRYRYSSFGLRWDMIRRNEQLDSFIGRISTAIANDEQSDGRDEEESPEIGSDDRWTVGFNTRSRGSLHMDMWMQASAADVATCEHLIVYPVIGWWRKRTRLGSLEKKTRYSLVVSIESEDVNVDIYNPVAVQVATSIAPTVVI